jgi:hypothetical protein
MCEEENNKPDSQVYGAPNRYCALTGDMEFPPLALRVQMKCIKTGVEQVILEPDQNKANMWDSPARPDRYRPHYPNVDVFECPNCGARVAKE